MSIVIRCAASDDRDRCLELIQTLTGAAPDHHSRTVYAELLLGERGEVLVAEEAPEGAVGEGALLLGVATVSYNIAIRYRGEYCQLEELIVDPAARGKNVGGLLVTSLVARARERGCAEVGLYLLESTMHNRSFYEKYGFTVIGDEMRQRLSRSSN